MWISAAFVLSKAISRVLKNGIPHVRKDRESMVLLLLIKRILEGAITFNYEGEII